MKTLPCLFFLLFVAQNPLFKLGNYKPLKPAYGRFNEDHGLTLHSDGTFEHRYYLVRMCLGKHLEYRRGTWQQKGDTLILTDSLYPQVDLLPYIKDFHYENDSAYPWIARYIIRSEGKLTFAYCTVGNMLASDIWPDFILDKKKNK